MGVDRARSGWEGAHNQKEAQEAGVQREAEALGPLLQQRHGAVAPLEHDDIRNCEFSISERHTACQASGCTILNFSDASAPESTMQTTPQSS